MTRLTGTGSFVDPNTIRVAAEGEETLLHGGHVFIATVRRRCVRRSFPLAMTSADSDEILLLTRDAEEARVIGGGVIGSEYAGTFAALGVQVHLSMAVTR